MEEIGRQSSKIISICYASDSAKSLITWRAWTLQDHKEGGSQAKGLWFPGVSNYRKMITWLAGLFIGDPITMMWRLLPTVWLKQGFGGWREVISGKWETQLWIDLFWRYEEICPLRGFRSGYYMETDWVTVGESFFHLKLGDSFKTSTSRCPDHSKWHLQKWWRDKLDQCGVRPSYLTCLPQLLTLALILHALAFDSHCMYIVQIADASSLSAAPTLLNLMNTLCSYIRPHLEFYDNQTNAG